MFLDARMAAQGFSERCHATVRVGCAAVLVALLAVGAAARAANDVPIVRVPAPAGSHGPLLIVLSGDGDWTAFMRELSETAAAHGAPVVGLKMRTYLSTPRKPEQVAADLEPVVRAALKDWQREDIVMKIGRAHV